MNNEYSLVSVVIQYRSQHAR